MYFLKHENVDFLHFQYMDKKIIEIIKNILIFVLYMKIGLEMHEGK